MSSKEEGFRNQNVILFNEVLMGDGIFKII